MAVALQAESTAKPSDFRDPRQIILEYYDAVRGAMRPLTALVSMQNLSPFEAQVLVVEAQARVRPYLEAFDRLSGRIPEVWQNLIGTELSMEAEMFLVATPDNAVPRADIVLSCWHSLYEDFLRHPEANGRLY